MTFNTQYKHAKGKPSDGYKYYVHVLQGKELEKGVSLTSQEFVDECNVNNIVDKYQKTGIMDNAEGSERYYADVSEYPSFEEALQYTIDAKESFQGLDPNLRKRFNNDPHALLEFLKDPKNKEEGQRIGLLKPNKPKPVKPEPTEVIITEANLKSAKEPNRSSDKK